MSLAVAAGLALVTLVGAFGAPSPIWFAPVIAVAILVFVPQSSRPLTAARCQLRQPSAVLLHAALGASVGLVVLLGVIAL